MRLCLSLEMAVLPARADASLPPGLAVLLPRGAGHRKTDLQGSHSPAGSCLPQDSEALLPKFPPRAANTAEKASALLALSLFAWNTTTS